jgi:cation diffusion facilitator CzcD-associated flavoprotein CzcO
LRRFINTSHAVTSTAWDPVANEWTVEVLRLDTGEVVQDKCDILVHATGYLNKPSWPKVPGLELFKGPKLHSAAYDESVSLEGKNVLIIGSGSSAVQILPAIQPIVDKTKIFIRSPSWLLPQISNKKDEYSPEEVAMFMKSPELVTALRQENERVMNSIFSKFFFYTCHCRQTKLCINGELQPCT